MTAPRSLLRLRGVVEAPADRVAPLIIDAPVSAEVKTVERDHAAGLIVLQGGWWYRSETRVAPHPAGTLVTQEIFDVAGGQRWAVRLVARKPLHDAPAAFSEQLRSIGAQLGCRGYAVPDAG